MGFTWGVLWAVIGMVTGLIIGVVDPDSIGPGEGPGRVGLIVGLGGFLCGAGFAILLSATENRKRLRDLSLFRVTMWGVLGSAALPLLTSMDNRMVYIMCPLGAVFAAGSLLIARKAERSSEGDAQLVDSASSDLLGSGGAPGVFSKRRDKQGSTRGKSPR